ncbi:phosphate-starvation-inducible E [Sulfurifustis variabilis]|uniref:Protein PsiE n=1 Tax=Sulfurifustis variabilis TaxID=1675686 RepID=A0A1C7AFC3_9GAMM|nr:phosphate-starvation-inducible PsiE family protein [Sulfurifustis variabilis]BAU49990.1 phosphate-starvation-inducible E [Sulfurifustis variabilis]
MIEDRGLRAGRLALRAVELIGLAVIGAGTVVAGGQEIASWIAHRQVTLADLLLLFIYLEVLAMVGLYLRSGQLPVRMPLYIGMVALARYLVLDIKDLDAWRMLAVAGAIVLLAGAVLLIRYGHTRFPYPDSRADSRAR